MKVEAYYFIGIGGIGMSAIARFLMGENKCVGGYDKTASAITASMENQGAIICYKDEQKAIPSTFLSKNTTVIYTPAVPKDHPQLAYFKAQGNRVIKRAVFLGELTHNCTTLAVAGTHGKTTTTSILSHLLLSLDHPFTAFVGGIMNDRQSNFISTGTETAVVEADEFDRSFLQLTPTIACITSMDPDHLDIYGTAEAIEASYREFASSVSHQLIVEKELPLEGVTYSIRSKADFYLKNIRTEGFGYRFDLCTPNGAYANVYFSQLGLHNLSNALAAFTMASIHGLDEAKLCTALMNFKGVERRLQRVYQSEQHILIDDYAHHPTEINAVLETVNDAYPEDEKCVIFQPHLFSRTKDFMEEFSDVLAQFDRVVLLPIYPARELPIQGVTSEVLVQNIGDRSVVELVQKQDLISVIPSISQKIILVLGAGDIGVEVEKIKEKIKADEVA